MIAVTAPQIARLLGRRRTWAWQRIRGGDFGPAVQATGMVGRPWLVDLAAVESFAGGKFSPEQLAAARIPVTEDKADEA